MGEGCVQQHQPALLGRTSLKGRSRTGPGFSREERGPTKHTHSGLLRWPGLAQRAFLASAEVPFRALRNYSEPPAPAPTPKKEVITTPTPTYGILLIRVTIFRSLSSPCSSSCLGPRLSSFIGFRRLKTCFLYVTLKNPPSRARPPHLQ